MENKSRNIEMVRKYSKGRTAQFAGKSLKTLVLITCGVALLAAFGWLTFTIGLAVGKHQFRDAVSGKIGEIYAVPDQNDVNLDVDFEPFWDAWILLEENFVGGASIAATTTENEITDQDFVWGAIEGLTRAYGDPFTSFLPPEESENFAADISGEFSGVGMEIGNREGFLTVISPLPGTPAYLAGVQSKDIVTTIDGVDSLTMPVEQAVKLIRGPKGEPVVLEIAREGKTGPIEITIVRDTIKIPTLETGTVGDTFVIKLYSFTADSPKLFQNAVKEFADSKKNQLVLDLRGNPGGYLEAAVNISSWFLSEDKVVVTEEYSENKPNKEHYSAGFNVFTDNLKMVILTDGGSASASEIVAGALRDYEVALLVGDTTFGKGSVQELFDLTRDTSIKITIAKWLTPSGDHISENGIAPDVRLAPPVRNLEDTGSYDLDFSTDTQIIDAIAVLETQNFKQLFKEVPESMQYVATTSNALLETQE